MKYPVEKLIGLLLTFLGLKLFLGLFAGDSANGVIWLLTSLGLADVQWLSLGLTAALVVLAWVFAYRALVLKKICVGEHCDL